jgi:hypothetical protein
MTYSKEQETPLKINPNMENTPNNSGQSSVEDRLKAEHERLLNLKITPDPPPPPRNSNQ